MPRTELPRGLAILEGSAADDPSLVPASSRDHLPRGSTTDINKLNHGFVKLVKRQSGISRL
jgi:hypothetical protein